MIDQHCKENRNDNPLFDVGQIVCADFTHCSDYSKAIILDVFYIENVNKPSENGYMHKVSPVGMSQKSCLVPQGRVRTGEKYK